MHLPASGGPAQRPNPRYLTAALVLVAGLLASLLAAAWVERQQAGELRETDRELAGRIAAGLMHRIEVGAVLARATQSWLTRVRTPSPDEFEAFYAELGLRESFPSVTALAFARRVSQPAGRERYPTELIAPREGNERLVGLDVMDQPENMLALERSRDSGEVALSGGFSLVQSNRDPAASAGVVVRVPVYTPGRLPVPEAERRERFFGSLALSFRAEELLRDVLAAEKAEDATVRMSDVTAAEPADARLLAALPANAWAGQGESAGTVGESIEFGGRRWLVEVRPSVAHGLGRLPIATFGSGAVASILLAALLAVQLNARHNAEALAEARSAQVRESERRFRALNELLPTAVLLARASDGRIIYANKVARDRFGIDPHHTGETLLPRLFRDEAMSQQIAQAFGGELRMDEAGARMLATDGAEFWGSVSTSTLELGGHLHWLAVVTDVSESRDLTDRLGFLASHDPLTELYNRREFERRVRQRVESLQKGAPQAALLYLDLDQFKLVNDTSGHVAGDQLLVALAGELAAALPEGALLARLGGDEFGVLIDGCDVSRALEIANRLRQAIDAFSFDWESRSCTVTVSIGIVELLPHEATDFNELLVRADTACYLAKEHGRNRIHVFSSTDMESTRWRGEMEWVGRLKSALAEERFRLYFQEIHPLRGAGDGVHLELLLRLMDERGHVVLPGAFLPAAERFDLVATIDRWVIEAALANFPHLHPSGRVASCAINLSAHTLSDPSLGGFVKDRLARSGVEPSRLCFEITETAAMAHMPRVVRLIEDLRRHGCRFAIDDFGAGMSSFAYLKNLPVDYVKIDGSFIRDLETDAMSYSIVRAVTEIGHQSGKLVTAEFVSGARAVEMLRDIGVDFVQGFGLHRPEPIPAHREPPGGVSNASTEGHA